MIKANANTVDRSIRALVSAALIYVGFVDQDIVGYPLAAYLLGFVGVLNVITVAVGWCPVYAMTGFSTAKKN